MFFDAPLVWVLLLAVFVQPATAVCSVCQGFVEGCTGGSDGSTCAGMASVASNAAALVATSSTALSLVGLFKPRVLRVFNATVLALLKQYSTAPVAGTPFDFTNKSGAEIVKAVISGKLSKSEAHSHIKDLYLKCKDMNPKKKKSSKSGSKKKGSKKKKKKK